MALTSHANVAGNEAEKANLAGYVQVTCQNVVGNRQVTNVQGNVAKKANLAGNEQVTCIMQT